MESLLERALRYVYNDLNSNYFELLEKASLVSLEIERKKSIVTEVSKIKHKTAPDYLLPLISKRQIGHGTRQFLDLNLPKYDSQIWTIFTTFYVSLSLE